MLEYPCVVETEDFTMLTVETINSLSDEELVVLSNNGNAIAEEHLINRYKNCVGYCSSKYYMPGMEKDDIFQEGMIGLYNAIKDFNPKKTSFKNFAMLCISRRIISLLKSANRQKHIPLNSSVSLDSIFSDEQYNSMIDTIETPTQHNPESILISQETLNMYEQKINELLSELELKVFKCYLGNMSYKDISKQLDISEKSVDNAVQRIKKKLVAVLI